MKILIIIIILVFTLSLIYHFLYNPTERFQTTDTYENLIANYKLLPIERIDGYYFINTDEINLIKINDNITLSQNISPANERYNNLIINNYEDSKYLVQGFLDGIDNFKMAFVLKPDNYYFGSNYKINGYVMRTANDFYNRDPTKIKIYGTNDNIDTNLDINLGEINKVLIEDNQELGLPDDRLTTKTFTLSDNKPIYKYIICIVEEIKYPPDTKISTKKTQLSRFYLTYQENVPINKIQSVFINTTIPELNGEYVLKVSGEWEKNNAEYIIKKINNRWYLTKFFFDPLASFGTPSDSDISLFQASTIVTDKTTIEFNEIYAYSDTPGWNPPLDGWVSIDPNFNLNMTLSTQPFIVTDNLGIEINFNTILSDKIVTENEIKSILMSYPNNILQTGTINIVDNKLQLMTTGIEISNAILNNVHSYVDVLRENKEQLVLSLLNLTEVGDKKINYIGIINNNTVKYRCDFGGCSDETILNKSECLYPNIWCDMNGETYTKKCN